MKNIIFTASCFLFIVPLFCVVNAQTERYPSDRYYNEERMWGIGFSYEVRSEDPTTGFGIRFERQMVPPEASAFRASMRAHFSYFNESNSVTEDDVTFDRDIEAYDFGLAILAGVQIVMAKPYIGLGVGSDYFNIESEDPDNNFNENNFFWNGFGGLEVEIFPGFSPFFEYRISRLSGTDEIDFDEVNRMAVGFNIRF